MQFDIKELLMLLGEKDLVIYQQQKTIDDLTRQLGEKDKQLQVMMPKDKDITLVKGNG